MFKLTEKRAATLTLAVLDECIAKAGNPETLFDQHGRVWSRWHAVAPGAYRVCAQCEKPIDSGYVLQPELTITICRSHVRRWV